MTDESPPKDAAPNPWQFSLRGLMLSVLLLSILLYGLRSHLTFTLFFILWSICCFAFMKARLRWRRNQQPSSLKLAQNVTLDAFIICLMMVPLLSWSYIPSSVRQMQGDSLRVRLIEEESRRPILNARVRVTVAGSDFSSSSELEDQAGTYYLVSNFPCEYEGSRWGSEQYGTDFSEVELKIIAPSYETRTLKWKDVSPVIYRAHRHPPLPMITIAIKAVGRRASSKSWP